MLHNTQAANMLELPFTISDVCVDEFLYVNKSLNSICPSYKVIASLQKIRTKPLDSYGLVLRSLYEIFEVVVA